MRAFAMTQGDLQAATPLDIRHRIMPSGDAIVDIGGELDIATADVAVSYVKNVIDRYRGPVTMDLTGLGFCDVTGLNGLLRLARHAEQVRCPFRLASPSPTLVKLMRITGLRHRFLLLPQGYPSDR